MKNALISGRRIFLIWFGHKNSPFYGHMWHKADRAALGLSYGVCFEALACVFASAGALLKCAGLATEVRRVRGGGIPFRR